MSIDPASPRGGTAEFGGQTFGFCSAQCRTRFVAEPARFLSPPAPSKVLVAAATPGVQYTCPMHPQIIRDAPGSCPLCGMALEPKEVTLTDEPNAELVSMTRRFGVSAALTVPTASR